MQSAKKWLAKIIAQQSLSRAAHTGSRTQRDFPPTASAIFSLYLVEANTQQMWFLDANNPLSLPVTDPMSFMSFLFFFVVVFIVRVSRAEKTHIQDA